MEQAVLIEITSRRDPSVGLDTVGAPIIAAVERSGVGEFDGNGMGPDGATSYLYGADAEALWEVVAGAINAELLGLGSHAIVRLGGPGSPARRIELA